MIALLLFATMLAETGVDPAYSWWWDTAQKIGAGATFVMGIGMIILWKEFVRSRAEARLDLAAKDLQIQKEIDYGKERDRQTLTVMFELSTLIKGIDKRDSDSGPALQTTLSTLIKTTERIERFILDNTNRNERQAA